MAPSEWWWNGWGRQIVARGAQNRQPAHRPGWRAPRLAQDSARTPTAARASRGARHPGRCAGCRFWAPRATIWRPQPFHHHSEGAMRYLCLIYDEEKKLAALSKSESEAFMGEYFAFTEGIKKSGHHVGGEALQPVQTATTVRVRNGKLSTTDGPFAETKEQLGGFYLINARDLNDAIQVASRIPSARIGTIEIRPVVDFSRQQQ